MLRATCLAVLHIPRLQIHSTFTRVDLLHAFTTRTMSRSALLAALLLALIAAARGARLPTLQPPHWQLANASDLVRGGARDGRGLARVHCGICKKHLN